LGINLRRKGFLQLVDIGVLKGQFKMDHVIAGKFKMGRKIGSGSFGELYIGLFHVSLSFELLNLIFLFGVIDLYYC